MQKIKTYFAKAKTGEIPSKQSFWSELTGARFFELSSSVSDMALRAADSIEVPAAGNERAFAHGLKSHAVLQVLAQHIEPSAGFGRQ